MNLARERLKEAAIMLIRRSAIGLVLALLLALPAAAQDYQKGLAALKRGDYETALMELRPLAEQGDAKAQHNLGIMYGNGQGVPQDYVLAHMWFSLSGAQGEKYAPINRDLAAK